MPGSIIIYTEEEINTFNHDVKLSLLSLGHFMSFRFATKEVKGVNYFPSRANDLEIWKKMLRINGLFSEIPLLSFKIVWSSFEKFENKCKNKHKVQIKLSTSCTTDLGLFANAMTVPTVDFRTAFWEALRIKTNNFITVFFFYYFYSITRFKKNSLADEWIPR